MDAITGIYFYSLIKIISQEIFLFFFKNFNLWVFDREYSFFVEQHLFLIFFNGFIYSTLLAFFFSIFFLFDFRVFRTLNEYKFFRSTGFINTTMVVLFLSLAGIPPLLGFLSKFFIFAALINSRITPIIMLMSLFNLFVMYFYIQNIRFLFTKSSTNIYFYKLYQVYINFSLISTITFCLFFNLFSIFFIDYLLISAHQIFFFVKLF